MEISPKIARDTVDFGSRDCNRNDQSLTEELLATSALLDDLNEARLQLFNGWYVIRQDAHFSRLGRYVDLDTAGRLYISTRLLDTVDVSGIAQVALHENYIHVCRFVD